MQEKYYLVKEKAVPEVLRKVLEAKKKIESGQMTVQQATDAVGISRSSFYKYQHDIVLFREDIKGETLTLILQMEDAPGHLSEVLQVIAAYHGNILTIHQSIPINSIATLTISVEISPDASDDASAMLDAIETSRGVREMHVLGRE